MTSILYLHYSSLSYKVYIMIPAIMIKFPIIFPFVIFSFKIKREKIRTKEYTAVSMTGPNRISTFVKHQVFKSKTPKKIPYAVMTLQFRYSKIQLLYFIPALCFNKICEIAEKKVPANIINIYALFIFLHHPYSEQNNQYSDNVLYSKIFFEDNRRPQLRP